LMIGLLLFRSFLMKSQNESPPSHPTILTFRLSPPAPPTQAKKPKVNWGGITGKDLKNWNFRDHKGQTFQKGVAPTQESTEVLSGVDGFEVFRRMGIETSSEIQPFLGALRERIQGDIEYPQRAL